MVRFCLLVSLVIPFAVGQEKVDFLKEVQPVLTARVPRHAIPATVPQAGLKIHTREDLTQRRKDGPGDSSRAGQGQPPDRADGRPQGMRMPPSGPPYRCRTIERIRLWIDQGAKFDGPATVTTDASPLSRPETPAIPAGTAANPIDRFIDAYFARASQAPQARQRRAVRPPRMARHHGSATYARRVARIHLFHDPDKRAERSTGCSTDRQAYAEHWISFWNDLLRNDEGVIYHGERKSITELAARRAREQHALRRRWFARC